MVGSFEERLAHASHGGLTSWEAWLLLLFVKRRVKRTSFFLLGDVGWLLGRLRKYLLRKAMVVTVRG